MPILNTLFYYCNEIEPMHHLYIELIGLEETFYDPDRGWLTLQIGETSIVMIRSSENQLAQNV